METKDFEIKVLTELASIKEMIKDYGRVKDDASEALTLSRQNKEDISEIKQQMEIIKANQSAQTEKKGAKWDKLIDYIFYAFIAILLGLLVAKLGLK